jgi:hypothetical protein
LGPAADASALGKRLTERLRDEVCARAGPDLGHRVAHVGADGVVRDPELGAISRPVSPSATRSTTSRTGAPLDNADHPSRGIAPV